MGLSLSQETVALQHTALSSEHASHLMIMIVIRDMTVTPLLWQIDNCVQLTLHRGPGRRLMVVFCHGRPANSRITGGGC